MTAAKPRIAVTWPVTPVIPATVVDGALITAEHTNSEVQCLSDLWTNMQSLPGVISAQTPWASDIDAAGHALNNVGTLDVTGPSYANGGVTIGAVPNTQVWIGNDLVDGIAMQATGTNGTTNVNVFPNGTSFPTSRVRLWNGPDLARQNNSRFSIQLSGGAASLTTQTIGAGVPITSMAIGENTGTVNLTAINFQFAGVTQASISSAGLITANGFGTGPTGFSILPFPGGLSNPVIQNNSANFATFLTVIPNGTTKKAQFIVTNSSDLQNYAFLQMTANGALANLQTGGIGTVATPITSLSLGENTQAAALTAINFTFNGVTQATLSNTGSFSTAGLVTIGALGAFPGASGSGLQVTGPPNGPRMVAIYHSIVNSNALAQAAYITINIANTSVVGSTAQVGLVSQVTVDNTHATGWNSAGPGTGLIALRGRINPLSNAAGVFNHATAVSAYFSLSGASQTWANIYGFRSELPFVSGGAVVTNQACFNVAAGFALATNNTAILLGTDTIPAGNFAIYDATGYPSVLSGALTLNGPLTINQTALTPMLSLTQTLTNSTNINVNSIICRLTNNTGTPDGTAKAALQGKLEILATNTTDWNGALTGNLSGIRGNVTIDSGAAGTINNVCCVAGYLSISPTAPAVVTSAYGFTMVVLTSSGSNVINYAGLCTPSSAGFATNTTEVLLGTSVIPAGKFAIYDATGNPSVLSGALTLGNAASNASSITAGLYPSATALIVKSSLANQATTVFTVPNGTSSASGFHAANSPDPNNYSHAITQANGGIAGFITRNYGLPATPITTIMIGELIAQNGGTYSLQQITFNFAGVVQAQFNSNGTVSLPNLPSVAPAAGSKQLWYDPADNNRVKYVP